MTDLATMLRQQLQNNLQASLDSAVQAGDINAARKASKDILDLNLAEARASTAVKAAPTKDEIKKAVTAKAPWFGVDPKKSAKALELAKMMDPERFETADAFADALLKSVAEDEAGTGKAADEDDEDEDSEDDEDAEAARREARRKNRQNKTPGTELAEGGRGAGGSSNLRRAMETGDIKSLPKDAADEIKKSASKFASRGNEEQRKAFIVNAVKARARSELIAAGKYDARTNKFK